MDEQIFVIQAYGGISRMFTELARQFIENRIGEVTLRPLSAPVVNHYILDDPVLRRELDVRPSKNEWTSLARYFFRIHTHPTSDIVHNTFYLPHGLAPTRGSKRVVTVHDMIPELMPQTRRRLDLLTLKRRYVDSADAIICVSEATKRDLLAVYPEVSAPISVIHHGVDRRFVPGVPPLEGMPEKYLLMVGNRGQYKDAATLFCAFAEIAGDHPDLALVCVGGGPLSQDEQAFVTERGLSSRVYQRNLYDSELSAIYGNAAVFVFPSRFEGFGLPALEAMACGAPTVLADATSLPEVGADATRYFEPGNSGDLAAVLAGILADASEQESLRQRGLTRAKMFDWNATAERTAAAYRAALDG